MLTQLELSGARTLLGLLPEEDVASLAQTITKGQIETPSKKGTNNLDLDLLLGNANIGIGSLTCIILFPSYRQQTKFGVR